MDSAENIQTETTKIQILPLVAALVALVGMIDSIYLTLHHYTGEKVPCSVTGGCETVLSSQYAEWGGIPLALFGVLAYFTVFSLATLTAFGDNRMWKILSAVVALMAAFSLWLVYLQAFVIGAFCQFCLLSAGTTFTLFLLVIIRQFLPKKLS
ncbi:MAG: vitamin K epoxide reductase family protein [Acidobacteriota bacterium]|nr:vitamin K epoxide reductase family protein [Acidobacteriota bacterium]